MLANRSLSALRWTVLGSMLVHIAIVSGLFAWSARHEPKQDDELVDIEIAPAAPKVEALPEEVATTPEQALAAKQDETDPATPGSTIPEPPPSEPTYALDAGMDAPPDAPPDAPIDARPKPDAPPDAPIDATIDAPIDATIDAGIEDATPMVAVDDAAADADSDGVKPVVAVADAGVPDGGGDAAVVAEAGDAGTLGDATQVGAAAGSGEGAAGSGSGDGSGAVGAGSIAMEAGSGSGKPGPANEPAVDGAPTTAGTAANLLTYLPQGHVVTALIRFDRLRGTEWAAQTERLLRPMPDYQVLFGAADAKLGDKLELLVISTPRPRDAAATTLVGRTTLARAALRNFLGAAHPVTWSTAKGGLVGKRTGRMFKDDKRVFVSPFRGWFLLAQPEDLAKLTAPVAGDLDTVEASGKLPAWLGAIRKIEQESGEGARGPALVVTLALGGKRYNFAPGEDFGLGVTSLPTPDRISLAMELVKQGWLVRGNMRFASGKDATEFIKVTDSVKQRVDDSRVIQAVLGKPLVRVVRNLSFARTGGRVSYATSVSIADARTILALLAQQLDAYFRVTPSP